MSEPGQYFRAREAAIASAQPPLDEQSIVGIARSARRLRRRGAVLNVAAAVLGAGVVGVVGLMLMQSLTDEEPALPAPSESVLPTPSESPSPSPSGDIVEPALIDGFAPVPQLPASEIPWDEVDAGWFLIDWRTAEHFEPPAVPGDADGPGPEVVVPEATGGFSLIGPDGTWYAALPYAGTGGGYAVAWDGTAVWLATTAIPDLHTTVADLRAVDLKTQGPAGDVDGVDLGSSTGIGPSSFLNFWYGGDGLATESVRPGADRTRVCLQFYQWEPYDMSGYVSPAGRDRIVCFAGDGIGDVTRVSVVDVFDPGSATDLATFQNDVYRYQFLGWLDSDSFLFARLSALDVDPSRGIEKTFQFDIPTDTITEVPTGELAGVGLAQGSRAIHDNATGNFVIETVEFGSGAWSVDIVDADHDHLAHIALSCAAVTQLNYFHPDEPTVLASGGRLLVTCPSEGWMKTFNVADGAETGSWDLGIPSWFSAFDHRG